MVASVAGRLEMQRERVVKKGPDIDFARSSFFARKTRACDRTLRRGTSHDFFVASMNFILLVRLNKLARPNKLCKDACWSDYAGKTEIKIM